MTKIKKILRRVTAWLKKCSFKKLGVLVGLASLLGLLIYLGVSLLLVSKAEVALLRLKNSIAYDKICHEECRLKREAALVIIAKALESSEKRVGRRLKAYLLEDNQDYDLRLELMKSLAQTRGFNNPPVYLRDYLSNNDGDPILQALILDFFSPREDEAENIAYYFSILKDKKNFLLSRAAIKNLSNIQNKESYFSLEQLSIIKDLLLDSSLNEYLRSSLVLLINDFYPLYPEASQETLLAAYQAPLEDNNISRAFAADTLNQIIGEGKYVLPEISAAEWQAYYNN